MIIEQYKGEQFKAAFGGKWKRIEVDRPLSIPRVPLNRNKTLFIGRVEGDGSRLRFVISDKNKGIRAPYIVSAEDVNKHGTPWEGKVRSRSSRS